MLRFLCLVALGDALLLQSALQGTQSHAARRAGDVCMGRKFENNKLKMAKTALAYAKKVVTQPCDTQPTPAGSSAQAAKG